MDISAFNWVDWAFFAVVLTGALHGLIKGFSKVLGDLLGLLVAIFLARLYYLPLADLLCRWWSDFYPEVARLVAILTLLVLGWILVHLVQKGLGALISISIKGWAERVLGFFAGGAWYGLVFLVVMWGVSFIDNAKLQRAVMFDSVVGRTALPHLQSAYNQLAEKARLAASNLPVGVESEPRAILPPGASDWYDDNIRSRFAGD